jgi:rhodanese-related sulfurtransferase
MQKIFGAILIVGMMLVTSGMSVGALTKTNNEFIYDGGTQSLNKGIVNLTVNEAYDFLIGPCSLEVPIDVRWNHEWNSEIIDTPIPEHARHFCLDLFQDSFTLAKFMSIHEGKDIILYCKGGVRSYKAAVILNNAGFSGTIYNMLGGITAWKAASLPTKPGGILNITVDDVWDLCRYTENGIQLPIDVRYDHEWNEGYIDTPWPECAMWVTKSIFEDPDGLGEFKDEFEGNEVIVYCKKGGRSLYVANILKDNDFNGTIYNMLGGISDWVDTGKPIRNNTQPDAPTINGPAGGSPGVNKTFELSTSDAEDDCVYYMVDWGDGTYTDWIGPFGIGEKPEFIHAWDTKGTYTITVKAMDFYGNQSDNSTHNIKIPRSKTDNYNLLELIFVRFSFARIVLRHLLGL